MIIGVVGKSGAGKNYVANRIAKEGYTHFDLDVYGHKALESLKHSLVLHFGGSILNAQGNIDRSLLGDVVFNDKKKLKDLKYFTTEWIENEVKNDMKENNKCILNGVILHESKLLYDCDLIIYVTSSLITRIIRLLKRDDRTLLQIIKRIWSQRDITKKLYKNCLEVRN